ncbi:hypothetical protein CRG98_034088 [Punica granatum]|uniref:Uncharacterized protein n=1 Tax=Punica granatum TaxID=22663 RepID=A0A2I0IPF5_PUNGR|nr:hypothetical protein CRG98_034088 [Punica granatum]
MPYVVSSADYSPRPLSIVCEAPLLFNPQRILIGNEKVNGTWGLARGHQKVRWLVVGRTAASGATTSEIEIPIRGADLSPLSKVVASLVATTAAKHRPLARRDG